MKYGFILPNDLIGVHMLIVKSQRPDLEQIQIMTLTLVTVCLLMFN